MGENITTDISQALRGYLQQNLGLNFNERQNKELQRKMDLASSSFGFSHTGQFVNWMLNSQLSNDDLFKLAGHLTIGETYFMREKKGYDFLEQIYLPGLIHKRLDKNRKLRVWCAGCATGEEAYSLAIVLQQSIPMISEWDVSILATDINPVFLEKARKGSYTKWSFRNNTKKFIEDYFVKNGTNEFQIIPEIKRMVKFSSINLASEDYPSTSNNTIDFDIIFCRNVLIYFSNEGIGAVTERFYHSLKKGGVLVVSPVEMSNLICQKFNSIFYSGFTIYHKDIAHAITKVATILPSLPTSRIRKVDHVIVPKAESKPTHVRAKTVDHKPIKPTQFSKIKEVNENRDLLIDFKEIKVLYDQGVFEETENRLTSYLIKSETPSAEAFLMMAKTKANLGKLMEAEYWCIKGLNINKLDFNLHYLLATIMQETGNDDRAINALKMALYLDPNFVLAHFLLGTLLAKNGDAMASKKAYKNALSSLSKYAMNDVLPESDGLTAGRFTSIINSIAN